MFMAFDGTGYLGSTSGTTERGLKKMPWIPDEDEFLKEYASNRGEAYWGSVQDPTRLDGSGKSCRNRLTSNLRPYLKKGAFSADEEEIIIELVINGLASLLSKFRCRIECWVKPKMGPPSWSIHDISNRKLRSHIPNANPPYLSHRQPYNPVVLEDRKAKNIVLLPAEWRIPAFQQQQPSAGLQNPGIGKPEVEMVENFLHVNTRKSAQRMSMAAEGLEIRKPFVGNKRYPVFANQLKSDQCSCLKFRHQHDGGGCGDKKTARRKLEISSVC